MSLETRKRRSIPKIISDEQLKENVKAHDVLFCILFVSWYRERNTVNEQEQIGLCQN
jgi:hypothetical protein